MTRPFRVEVFSGFTTTTVSGSRNFGTNCLTTGWVGETESGVAHDGGERGAGGGGGGEDVSWMLEAATAVAGGTNNAGRP